MRREIGVGTTVVKRRVFRRTRLALVPDQTSATTTAAVQAEDWTLLLSVATAATRTE